MKLLILAIKQSTALAQGLMHEELYALLPKFFPGSRIYGPGFPGYATSDVREILEEFGGESNFDAIFCMTPERELAGDVLGFHLPLKYNLPSNLWRFPVNLDKVNLPKILFIGDFWHLTPAEWNAVLLGNGFDLVCGGMLPPLGSARAFSFFFQAQVLEKVVFLPIPAFTSHHVFHNPGVPKRYDVLLSGAQAPEFYPVRSEMLRAFAASNLKLCCPRHPGYSQLESVSPPSTYREDLNASRISAFCTSKYHFAPMKLVEAMASHTIVLCDAFGGMELFGMEPDKHFILADGANCVEKARRWLADEEMYREMTDAAYKLFRSRHTVEIRLKEMSEQIPAALNGKRAEGWLAASPNYRLVRGLARRRALEPSERKPAVTAQDYWDNPVTVQRETWRYWRWLSPLPQPDEKIRQEVRLPPMAPLRMAAMGHCEVFRAQWILDLIAAKDLRSFLEIGTGSGYHSVLWADYLNRNGKRGVVFAEDPIGGDQLITIMSPEALDTPLTRDLLWAGIPAARDIRFIHRGPGCFEPLANRKLDLIYINSSNDISGDLEKLKTSIAQRTIIIVNKCCPAYEAVAESTLAAAEALGRDLTRLDFGPPDAGLGLLMPCDCAAFTCNVKLP